MLSRKWSIPLTKLDLRKLYELSQKPPNWSEMDPYSDSDIENISTTPEGNVDDSDNNMQKDDENAKYPSRMGNMECSVQSANKYQLQERKDKTVVAYSLRISNRSKKSISYAESDDENDSDYKPIPKKARYTNVGLHKPSKSQLLAHARSIQAHTPQAAKEDTLQNPPVLPNNSDRNKKCPYCETSFYYEKSVDTHIEHAHSDRLQPKSVPIWA